MQTVIPVSIEDGRILLDPGLLPQVWLTEPIEAVLKDYGILIKPKSWSDKTRGIVAGRLSYAELDELCSFC